MGIILPPGELLNRAHMVWLAPMQGQDNHFCVPLCVEGHGSLMPVRGGHRDCHTEKRGKRRKEGEQKRKRRKTKGKISESL